MGALSATAVVAAELTQALAPMPLVLKDGRVARVTVHAIPFETGAERLDAPTREALDALARSLATDCFLTAQAIGHVEPGPGSDGDTLAAHRLARARADRVQAELVGAGLPAPAIASVWDWQFALRAAQVTLWVFRLTEGDDCDGKNLAQVPTPPARAEPEPEQDRAAAATPAAGKAPPLPKKPKPPDPPRAEAPPPEPAAGPPAGPPAGSLALAFDADNSFLPDGAAAQLEALAAGLDRARRWEVVLAAAVAPGAKDQKARDFARWIAERRMARVAEVLDRAGPGRNLRIRQQLLPDDASRQVTVTVRPAA
ncbi:MAG: hypothetical protein U1E14_11155 [Geminicoccaceae bacterium]